MSEKVAHHIEISYEPRSERHCGGGARVFNAGHRARCSCGWWSDCWIIDLTEHEAKARG